MNIKQLLDHHGIEYSTGGKNTSRGWIGVQCPFCDDTSDHLGIRLNDFKVKCWKCGNHSISSFLVQVLNITYSEAKEIVKELDEVEQVVTRFPKQGTIHLPVECTDEFPKLHIQYLKSRGFNPRKLIKKYNLKACYTTGKYAYRIIIPIYENGILKTWTSRDVTNKQKERYKAATIEESAYDPVEAIYNIDNVKEYHDAFLVEGPTDVWKMGNGSMCFMGVKWTQARLLKIAKKNIQRLFIFYDQDRTGYNESKRIARVCSPLVKTVTVLRLKNSFAKGCDDPGKMSYEDVMKIKHALKFNG